MNRRKDPVRRRQLLLGAVRHVLRHGIGGLSLRPLAKEIGTTARMLIHHFGSKEALIIEVLATLERDFAERIGAFADENRGLAIVLQRMWSDVAAPDMQPALRAMFEVWGYALVHPQAYRAFLHSLTEPWIARLQRHLERSGRTGSEAALLATLAVAAFQGLQLVQLSSGKSRRSELALRALFPLLAPRTEDRHSRKRRRSTI